MKYNGSIEQNRRRKAMTISQYFPIYDQLDKADQERLDYAA